MHQETAYSPMPSTSHSCSKLTPTYRYTHPVLNNYGSEVDDDPPVIPTSPPRQNRPAMKRVLHRFARPSRQQLQLHANGWHASLLDGTFRSSRRCFATGSNGNKDDLQGRPGPLSFQDGWRGVWQFVTRVLDRMPKLDHYQTAHAFHPDSSHLEQSLLFTRMNMPTNTEIDLLEFLDGAKLACRSVLRKILSKEFMDACRATTFTTTTTNDTGGGDNDNVGSNRHDDHDIHQSNAMWTTESRQVAQDLQRVFAPLLYKRLVQHTQRLTSKNKSFSRAEDVELLNAYLVNCRWIRLLRSEYQAQRDEELRLAQVVPDQTITTTATATTNTTTTGLDVGPDEDSNEFVELLQMTVRTDCKIGLQFDQDRLQKGTSSMEWCFESVVTHPNDLDWILISFSINPQSVVVSLRDANQPHDTETTSPSSSSSSGSSSEDHTKETTNKLKQAIAQAAREHQQRESQQEQQEQEQPDTKEPNKP